MQYLYFTCTSTSNKPCTSTCTSLPHKMYKNSTVRYLLMYCTEYTVVHQCTCTCAVVLYKDVIITWKSTVFPQTICLLAYQDWFYRYMYIPYIIKFQGGWLIKIIALFQYSSISRHFKIVGYKYSDFKIYYITYSGISTFSRSNWELQYGYRNKVIIKYLNMPQDFSIYI